MNKVYCDCCRKEIKNNRSHNVSIPCHIWEFRGKPGYVSIDEDTGEWYGVSGRSNNIDLCIRCWNIAYSGMVESLLKEQPKMIEEYKKNYGMED